jgi:hypothetical protein
MTQNNRLGTALLALMLAAGAAAAGAQTSTTVQRWVPVASDARADYERGFTDGLNGKLGLNRDQDYRSGHRAGKAKREANEARADGKDYSRGYLDGYNRWRERVSMDSKNRAYAAGFRAGQSERTALVTAAREAAAAPVAAATSVDNLVGRPASRLDKDMAALGFVRMGQFKQGKESFSTWQSKGQNRCVRIMSREGKVKELTDLDNDRCT